MIIPNKHCGFRADGTRLALIDSGGGGGTQQSTSYTTNVPEYAQKPFMDMIGRAEALYQAPYQAYGGERAAQFTPMQQQAFQQGAQQGVAGQIGQASGIAGIAAQQGLQAGQFQPGTFTPMSVQAPSLQNFQMTPAQQVSAQRVGTQGIQAAQTGFAPQLQQFQMEGPQSFTQAGTAEQYMNPYMQNVVDIQKREAQRAADIAGTERGAQAVRAGAFGGSRQAILDAEAQRNLAQQMGDIQATGSQAAFQQAQQQFNQEQQARQAAQQANLQARLGVQELGTTTGLQTSLANLNAEQQARVQSEANRLQAQGMNQEAALRSALANQQAGLTVGQQNLSALLGVQQLGSGQSMQAQMANQQALLDAQRAFEQSRQFGADLGLRGGAQALQGAGILGQLGQQQFGQEMDILGARERLGTTQQQQIQRILDQQYADFQQQRDFPYQQIGFMSDLLRGTGSSTRTMAPAPNQMAQLAGAGLSAYGLARAEGGEIPAPKRFAVGGGITGLLPDEQLQERMESPTVATIAKMAAEKELMDRNQLRTGIASAQQGVPQMPTQTVAEEMLAQMGIGSLPVPDDVMPDETMAGGGIVAFSNGGPIVLPAGTPWDVVEQTRLENPGVEVRTEDEGSEWRALGRGVKKAAQGVGDFLTYNSDVAAAQARGQQASDIAANQAKRTATAGIPVGAPATGIAQNAPAAQGAQQPQAGAPAAQGIASLSPAARMAEVQRLAGDDSQLRERAQQMGDAEIAAREADIRELQADQAEGAQFWTDMRKKVEDRIGGLSKQEYDAKTNQILGIGAALMANKSPNFGVAVGEALGVGLKLKREDEERLRKAKDELDARQDELAALERGEKRADKKELREAKSAYNNAKTNLARSLYELDKDTFNREFSLAKDVVEAAAKERSAREIAGIYMSGREGAGAGRKWTELTAAQRAQYTAKAADIWNKLSYAEKIQYQNTGGTRESWVAKEAQRLVSGEFDGGAAPTSANISAADKLVGL